MQQPFEGGTPGRLLLVGCASALDQLEGRLGDATNPALVVGRLDIDAIGRSELPSRLAETVAACSPDLALVSVPAVFAERLASLRTMLRRLSVPDRFVPTFDDLLAGVGPRSLPEVDLASLLDRADRPLDRVAVRRLCRGRRVLVTGAGGSIGSALCEAVAEFDPAELVMMDRSEHALFEIDRSIARRFPLLRRRASLQDVAERSGTLRLFEETRPNLVLHAAAHKHVPLSEDHPSEALRNNLEGSLSAVDAAIAVGASEFVLVSTDKAVAPRSVMGATKRLAEVAVQRRSADAGLACSVVRFGNVLGSSGSVLEIWSSEIREGGPLGITDHRMTRYLMTIPEAAGLVLQSASLVDRSTPTGLIHVLDMGEPVLILDLARRFAAAHGLELVVSGAGGPSARPGTIAYVETGIRPGEKLSEILAHPGEDLESTAHPAIRAWHGVVPPASEVDRILRLASSPAGTSKETVSDGIRRAIEAVEPGGRRHSVRIQTTRRRPMHAPRRLEERDLRGA